MKRDLKSLRGVCLSGFTSALLGLLWSPAQARAEVVYENCQQPYDQFWGDKKEFGDEINLGGEGRTITKFQFEYFGYFTDTGNQYVKVRFYANDGEGHDSTVGTFGKPGTLLYEGWPVRMASGYNVVTLSELSVTVPESRFTWTVEFEGVTGNYGDSAGLTIYNPPSIGSSFNDFWYKLPAGWQEVHFPGGNPFANFSARVEATPDTPLTVAAEAPDATGGYALTLTGPAHRSARLETSLDAHQWTPVRSVVFTGEPIRLTDRSGAGETNRQYRLGFIDAPVLELALSATAEGRVTVDLTGTPGKTAALEASADNLRWLRVSTNYFQTAGTQFVDSQAAAYPHRFYRGYFIGDSPVIMGSPRRLDNGMVLLAFGGPPGRDCRLESTRDFKTWKTEDVRTLSFTGGAVNYLDTSTTNGAGKYYRATLLP